MAELTCSGALWATTRESGERVNVDSWIMEVHYLIYEDGKWKFRGKGKGRAHTVEFGAVFHPLF